MAANLGSRDTARAAIHLALSRTREEEMALKQEIAKQGIRCVAVDYGGEFIPAIMKMVERSVVAAKREGVILETHLEEGAVAGAAHEAISQLTTKAMGLNVGGKIGIARAGDHVCVAVFLGIGLLHLNEMAIGMGHRAL